MTTHGGRIPARCVSSREPAIKSADIGTVYQPGMISISGVVVVLISCERPLRSPVVNLLLRNERTQMDSRSGGVVDAVYRICREEIHVGTSYESACRAGSESILVSVSLVVVRIVREGLLTNQIRSCRLDGVDGLSYAWI